MEPNPKCPKCFREMESIFGSGRSLWCPDCESHSKSIEKKDDGWVTGDGFKMREKPRELPIIGSDEDRDEITLPMIDLGDLDLD